MSDLDDHAYGAYQHNPYHGSYQDGSYQDGAYQNEGSSDPVMPQPDEMEETDAVERGEPRKQKERRRELEEDDEEEEEDDDDDDEEDEGDPGRKKKRVKVCPTLTSAPNSSGAFTYSIATNGPLPVVSLILKPRLAMKTRRTKTRRTLEEVGYF